MMRTFDISAKKSPKLILGDLCTGSCGSCGSDLNHPDIAIAKLNERVHQRIERACSSIELAYELKVHQSKLLVPSHFHFALKVRLSNVDGRLYISHTYISIMVCLWCAVLTIFLLKLHHYNVNTV